MIYLLLFIFELALLFFLSKKVINALTRIIFKVTRSHRVVVHSLAIIFLPGTIIHELAHLLFAGVMLVPVGELNVVPEIEDLPAGKAGKGVRLGSLQIGRADPFRRIIVGVAPVFLGMILISSIFLFVKIGTSPWWQVILALYFIFEIGNTMFSSRKDLEGSILFAILIFVLSAVIFLFLYFLAPGTAQSLWIYISGLNWEFVGNFSKQAATYLLIPVVLDLLVILLTFSINRRRSLLF